MTFRTLALKNIRVNWRSYSAFFLSSLFSVAIFYIYYAFIVHPDVVNGQIVAASKVRSGMSICLYLIAIFSMIFISYSSGSFLKSRKKEFGLFSLFGMTRRQLRRLVFIENMMIGILATFAGIGVGILFSKLFLMGLGALLEMEQQIRFAIPPLAIVVTLIVFIGIFLVITLYTTLKMHKGQIIDLLKADKQPKGELKFSWFKVILGTISLLLGYGMAVTVTLNTIGVLVFPVIGLVVLGTLFLYSQLSIIVLQTLKRNKKLFYNRSNLLIISQLGYKIKDNARILFTITILSAVVMTAMGTIYVMQKAGQQGLTDTPYSLAWVEIADPEVEQLDRKQLDELIGKYDLNISEEAQINGLRLEQYLIHFDNNNIKYGNGERGTMLVPQTVYNEHLHMDKGVQLANDEAAVSQLYLSDYGVSSEEMGKVIGEIGKLEFEMAVTAIRADQVINDIVNWSYPIVVISDERYAELLKDAEQRSRMTVHGIEFGSWKASVPMIEELLAQSSSELLDTMDYSRNLIYSNFMQSTSLTLFIGLFICFLFFIAAGSLIYFKLFTERDEDLAMFKGLSRIGLTYKEMKRVIVSQVAIIFFLPCVVGLVHALFAMLALKQLSMTSDWLYSFVVFGIYVVMQGIYFLIASRSYLNSIRKAY